MKKGIVYLIGAGCGKKDLITLRGLELLRKADAVVYDDLIDNDLLNEAENAELIYMGKRSGCHSARQEEICAKLVELSKSGKTVARLKGGDPFVFGRGGEEILELRREEIPFELVPGISSSIAIPAFAGIPVTHRKLSRGFMVITGHTADESEEKELISSMVEFPGTIVILMGLGRIEKITSSLIEKGKNPDMPASVISGGNSPHPMTVRGTLSDIAERTREEGVQTPAVIVIGNTAGLNLLDESPYRSLRGIRVGITGTPIFSSKLEAALKEKGAEIVNVLKTKVIENKDLELSSLLDGKEKWLVITSANGVRTFFEKMKRERIDYRRLYPLHFAVIGKPTGKVLEEHGIKADLMPEVFTSEELGKLMIREVSKDSEIVLLRADNANDTLPEMLRKNGFKVKSESLYSIEPDRSGKVELETLDYLTFSSSYGVELFFSEYGRLPENIKPVAIGEITASKLRKYYSGEFLLSRTAEVESLVETMENDSK